MIRWPVRRLPNRAAQQLQRWQHEIDELGPYEAQVQRAAAAFSSRNKATNATFRVVRQTLAEMCSGARRCAYCEDSVADEVEHVRPKALYPGQVFRWENYVYACGPCNGPKSSKFAVIVGDQLVDVTRRRGDPIQPPHPGEPAVFDPRTEDASAFLVLDLEDTFQFVVVATAGTLDELRAEYTIELLRLNAREELAVARQRAYENYRARLREYVEEKRSGYSNLAELVEGLRREQHPSVWFEMKRQRERPDLVELFNEAPEALDW